MEEDLEDKLADSLRAPKRPAVVFIKNLYTYEMEEYEGPIERTSLSLWLQDRGSRKLASPEKTIKQLTKETQPDCGRADNNLCVVAYFSGEQEKLKMRQLLQPGLARYKDEPVNFYIIDTAAIRLDCRPESSTVIYRSKRNKKAAAEPAELFNKLDSLLGGMPFPESMGQSIADCFE